MGDIVSEYIHQFLNKLSIDEAIAHGNYFIRLLAVLDVRLGKRRIKALADNIDTEPEWFRKWIDAGKLTSKFGEKVTIQVAPEDCMGCELCVVQCPMKAKGALCAQLLAVADNLVRKSVWVLGNAPKNEVRRVGRRRRSRSDAQAPARRLGVRHRLRRA